jgi:hypothetical protein
MMTLVANTRRKAEKWPLGAFDSCRPASHYGPPTNPSDLLYGRFPNGCYAKGPGRVPFRRREGGISRIGLAEKSRQKFFLIFLVPWLIVLPG